MKQNFFRIIFGFMLATLQSCAHSINFSTAKDVIEECGSISQVSHFGYDSFLKTHINENSKYIFKQELVDQLFRTNEGYFVNFSKDLNYAKVCYYNSNKYENYQKLFLLSYAIKIFSIN